MNQSNIPLIVLSAMVILGAGTAHRSNLHNKNLINSLQTELTYKTELIRTNERDIALLLAGSRDSDDSIGELNSTIASLETTIRELRAALNEGHITARENDEIIASLRADLEAARRSSSIGAALTARVRDAQRDDNIYRTIANMSRQ